MKSILSNSRNFTNKAMILIASVGLSSQLFQAEMGLGQELAWQLVSVSGSAGPVTCDQNSVSVGASGTDLALIFRDMTASLAAGDPFPGNALRGHCRVTLDMFIPQGHYLMNVDSTLTGGVEKSIGGSGAIEAATYIMGQFAGAPKGLSGSGPSTRLMRISQQFGVTQFVSEPVMVLRSSFGFSGGQQKIFCASTRRQAFKSRITVDVGVSSQRQNSAQTSIIAVDSIDTSYRLGLRIARCL